MSADSIVPGAGSLTLSPHDAVASGMWGKPSGGPGNPQDLNRYSYGLNNPVRNTDPTGHCPVCAVVGAIAGAGIAYGVQVYANTQKGMDLGQAMTTDINYAAIGTGAVAGAVIGGTLGIAAGASGIAGYTVGSAVQLGAVGAAANMTGNAIGQYVTSGTINHTDLAVAGVTGFAAGAAAPIVASTGIGGLLGGYVGSIGLGATANVAQYAATQSIKGDPITGDGVKANAFGGALGGVVGGPTSFVKGLSYLRPGIEAPNFIRQNITTTNITRGLLSGMHSNYNYEPFTGAK